MAKQLKIGMTVYCVHKDYVDKNVNGAKVIPCKIRSYQNMEGTVQPMVRAVGSRNDLSLKNHTLYTDLDKAVKAIGPPVKPRRK
jgi:hypothetical protein